MKGLLSRVGRPDRIQLVFLMHQEVTKKHREPLQEIVESFGAPAPIVKYPELELELDFRTEDGDNVLSIRSQTPFYRLFLPTMLPEADQCLYLDIDIAILDDLTPLMETDLGDCYIGGVPDRLCLDPAYDKHTTVVGIKPAHYINGGVIHPSIVHYVGPRKPWENSEVEYADLYHLM